VQWERDVHVGELGVDVAVWNAAALECNSGKEGMTAGKIESLQAAQAANEKLEATG
jgi:hypothetical protein